MATVVDAARGTGDFGDYNTAYQKGNDHADTPNPTWLQMYSVQASVAETPVVPKAQNTPTDNTGDAWVSMYTVTWLDSTPNTYRPVPTP